MISCDAKQINLCSCTVFVHVNEDTIKFSVSVMMLRHGLLFECVITPVWAAPENRPALSFSLIIGRKGIPRRFDPLSTLPLLQPR